MNALRPLLLTALWLLAVAAPGQELTDQAQALYEKAAAAYKTAADAGDSAGQKAAAAELREALALFNQHLDEHPGDLAKHEATLTEINAILFWHGRMTAPDLWGDEESPAAERDRARGAEQREEDATHRRQQEATALLEVARGYGLENPDDLYGRRVELREVLIQFPDTPAAEAAEAEIEELDRQIAAREAALDELDDETDGAPTPDQIEEAAALAPRERAVPLLHLLRQRLDQMKGSETERFVLGQIRDLFARRRFIEAQERCRAALTSAAASRDEARIDRIVASLSRAVTIMDQVVAELGSRVGDDQTLELIGGGSFTGQLEKLTWNAVVLRTEQAELHVPYFRLADDSLVELAAARRTPAAALATAAFLALGGHGQDALNQLRQAEKLGASRLEIESLRHLAGDEKAKRELEDEIKDESRRWRGIVKLESKVLKEFEKKDYLDCLKYLLKQDKRSGLTERDLAWLSDRSQEAVGLTFEQMIRDARELCPQQHADEERTLICPKCKGAGTILTRNPGGLFGVKKRSPVRVRCPTCDGKKQVPCPECYNRFHDTDARELQRRAALARGGAPLPEDDDAPGGGVDR